MVEEPERQPYVRWRRATISRPAQLLDLFVFTIWSTLGARLLSHFIHLFIHELLTHARRHVAWL